MHIRLYMRGTQQTPLWDWFQSKQKVERGRECSSSAFGFLLGLKTAWDSTNTLFLQYVHFVLTFFLLTDEQQTPLWDWFQSKQKVERGRECSSSAFGFLLGLKTAWDSTNTLFLQYVHFVLTFFLLTDEQQTPLWDWFQSKQKVERGRECSSSAFYFLLGLKTAWDSTNAVVLVCLFFW